MRCESSLGASLRGRSDDAIHMYGLSTVGLPRFGENGSPRAGAIVMTYKGQHLNVFARKKRRSNPYVWTFHRRDGHG